MPLSSGTRLGPYEIIGLLGTGGMGEVYKARDPRLERDVAIKVSNQKFTERFQREARAIAAFNHPHICQIYDIGPNFLVMEYIEGQVLKGPLPINKALDYAIQICAALEAAHKKNIIHRDLKPANILVHQSGIKLLDFGLAKVTREDEANDNSVTSSVELTRDNTVLGTLQYMSPEQLQCKEVDTRSDIFSFGALLYEMVTGKHAFEGESQASVIAAILERDPPSVTSVAPAALDSLLHRCLAKNPDQRWQSAQDIKYELQQIAQSEAAVTQPTLPAGTKRARFPWSRIVVIGLLILAAVGGFWFQRLGKHKTQSIAVLPFADLSPETNQEYFSAGLAEELLNGLAKVPGLRVTGRISSFRFSGKTEDSRIIGQKLNVTTLLEGSVRKQGNRVRISVQLIHAADGFQLWSAMFDRQMDDIFTVQEEIARAVTGALKVTLLGEKAAPTTATNLQAYNAYLQGRYFAARGTQENLQKAVALFEQSIQLAPNYAPAWAGLGAARINQADWGYLPVDAAYRKAREAVERAMTLDGNLGGAHVALGLIQMFHDWDWAGADASYRRALQVEPSNSDALGGAGTLGRVLGHMDEAIDFHRRAVENDPLNPTAHHELGLALHYAAHQDEATAALRKSLEISPEMVNSHCLLSRILLAQSQPQEALVEVKKEAHPIFRVCGLALANFALADKKEADANLAELIAKYQTQAPYQVAEVYAFRNENDRAFEWLERAFAARDAGLTEIKADPLLKGLRSDRRYIAVLQKMRLPL